MSAEHDDYDEVQSVGAGASHTHPEQCSKLRKNGFVMIRERPCKVVEMSTSKTGKHGHAKVHYVGLDIFTGKKYEDICPSTHSVNVPSVCRCELQVIEADDGFISCLNEKNEVLELKLPEKITTQDALDLMNAAKDDESVFAVIVRAVGIEAVLELKTAKHKP